MSTSSQQPKKETTETGNSTSTNSESVPDLDLKALKAFYGRVIGNPDVDALPSFQKIWDLYLAGNISLRRARELAGLPRPEKHPYLDDDLRVMLRKERVLMQENQTRRRGKYLKEEVYRHTILSAAEAPEGVPVDLLGPKPLPVIPYLEREDWLHIGEPTPDMIKFLMENRPIRLEDTKQEPTHGSSPSTPGTTSTSTPTSQEPSSSSTNKDLSEQESGLGSSYVSLRGIRGFY